MPVFEARSLPGCLALVPQGAGAAGRWFAAWSGRGGARWLLGQGVLDEFGTFSSPLLLAHPANLGRLYDAGLTLAQRRDPEMPLDAGWPPLCVGAEVLERGVPADWEERIVAVVQGEGSAAAEQARPLHFFVVGGWNLEGLAIGEVAILATDAPLLPRQLRRLAAAARPPFALAFSTGNRLAGTTGGAPLAVRVASEATAGALAAAAAELLP